MRSNIKYITILILFLFLVFSIIYGSILRHHYIGGKKFKPLQNIAVFFAEIPSNLKKIIRQMKNKAIAYHLKIR